MVAVSEPEYGGKTPLQWVKELETQHRDVSLSVIVVMALVEIMKLSTASSTSEFAQKADTLARAFEELPYKPAAMKAGVELFKRPVNALSASDDDWRTGVFKGFEEQLADYQNFRERAADNGLPFVKDNAVILVHSYSRAVMLLLQKARKSNKRLKVFVTETRPTPSGTKAVVELRQADIRAELILDSAVGAIMAKVDMVIVGAEGVVQNGGLINQIGTYQIAVVAKASNKPFYAVTEQYKFVRWFPLNQDDLPGEDRPDYFKYTDSADISPRNPHIDYTPPEYISLLFTNVGVLTPSGVSEELVKFYIS
ncbi:Translation initiation factor [Thoreauomyces humboldtii]|nr:Translation initiation factor [Thoreauomyces humboldtii]